MMNILNDLLAAITFFTRIPAWKIREIPAESYKRMIYFWPLTGWLTAGVTVLSWILLSAIFPPLVAIVLALATRVVFTGGFHEDGLGDFFDGFGGGRTKTDVLRIMKDSHAGSYSVLGLIFYYLLLVSTFYSLPAELVPLAILAGDPLSKFITTILMNLLPYARPESDSKSKTTYDKLSWWKLSIAFVTGAVPLLYFVDKSLWLACVLPVATMLTVFLLSKKKIQGYTGDVCGATALLCELSFYLGVLALLKSEIV
ncbi:MAG: cobalamin 5'-phosphate synthase [Bacteroidales bacterium 45-6]|nr:MAG: cobalamin 5'-phosphate synthase [Bacteroidales bacterium 45-6]